MLDERRRALSLDILLRLAGMIVFGVIGWRAGLILTSHSDSSPIPYIIAAVATCLGLVLTPGMTLRPLRWLSEKIHQIPVQDLVAGLVGLVLGLLIAALLAIP